MASFDKIVPPPLQRDGVHQIDEWTWRQLERTLDDFRSVGRNRHVFLMDLGEAINCGKQLFAEPRRPRQRLTACIRSDYGRTAESVYSDAFRARMDAWLIEFFGYERPVVPRGAAIRIGFGAILNPDDFEMLAKAAAEAQP